MGSVEYFFKTFGPAIGPAIAVILIYIKLAADSRFARKNNRINIKKIKELIRASLPPEWIKTYSEPGIVFVKEASGCNAYNLGIFERRIITINHLINEILKDVYKNPPIEDIDLLSNLKYKTDFIIKEITSYRNELESISLKHAQILREYEKKSKIVPDLAVPQELLDIDRELTNKMMFTNVLFMMVGFHYEHMIEIIKIPLKLELNANYQKYNEVVG